MMNWNYLEKRLTLKQMRRQKREILQRLARQDKDIAQLERQLTEGKKRSGRANAKRYSAAIVAFFLVLTNMLADAAA